VVATFNRPDLLIDRCVRSLLAQTYRNLQIVIVGDNCTDDTSSRIGQISDSRIVFHNRSERGPYPVPGEQRWFVAGASAMNEGLSLCEGQFVTHLDDDDSAVPDRIETLVQAVQMNRADFCHHPFWFENHDGSWRTLGNGLLELGQVTTSAIFYHHYLRKFGWDVFAYRLNEPGDWNRLRKIRMLRPRIHYVDRPLVFHHIEHAQRPFTPQAGERFLE
jgi:glycosyltransferase involved in cell wall biosynthesis